MLKYKRTQRLAAILLSLAMLLSLLPAAPVAVFADVVSAGATEPCGLGEGGGDGLPGGDELPNGDVDDDSDDGLDGDAGDKADDESDLPDAIAGEGFGGMGQFMGISALSGEIGLFATSGYWSDAALLALAASGTDYEDDSGFVTVIKTELGLAYFASRVNAGSDYSGKTVTLAADLDLSAHYWVPISQGRAVSNSFVPPATPFSGTFDGGSHYISGLTIGGTDFNSGSGIFNEGNALFGQNNGTIRNVGVIDAYVDGYRRSAGIAGFNYGTIQFCMSTGSILANGGGSDRGSGGVAGTNYGTIQYCYSNASIYNAYRRAGGIAGYNNTGALIENCFFTGYAESANETYSGSIAATNNGGITNCYYQAGSAKDKQDNGVPSGYANGAQAYEFNAQGNLTAGGGLLAALNNGAAYFTSISGSGFVFPVLYWENTYHHTDVAPPVIPPAEPVSLTIISADGYFADVPLTKSQLEAKATTAKNYVRDANRLYDSVTGITLADLLAEFVPYSGRIGEVVFYDSYNPANPATNRTFYPNGGAPQGDTNDYSTAMLLWDGVQAPSWTGAAAITGLTSALHNASAGRYWWGNVNTATVTLPLSDVAFNVTPAGAAVTVKDSKGNAITASSPGVYKLVRGETYEYAVSAASYITRTGTYTPSAAMEQIDVSLTPSGGGSVDPNTPFYTVTGYSGANGSVTASPGSAQPGATVTLTVNPASGYALSSLSVTGIALHPSVSSLIDTYTFSMPEGNVTVSAAFEAAALIIRTQQGETGTPVKAAIFTQADLNGLAEDNSSGWAYLYYSNSVWRAVVATRLVSLDALLNAAGVSNYWKQGSFLSFTCTDGPYTKSYPDYNDIQNCAYYVGDSGSFTVVPAGLAITHESGDLNPPPGRDASVASLALRAHDSGNLRFVYGVSQESYNGPSYAAGARSPFGVVEMTLIYAASSIPPGDVGTTHSSGGAAGGAAVAITGGDGSVQLTYTQSGGTTTLLLPEAQLKEVIEKTKNKTSVFDLSKVPGGTAVETPKTALAALAAADLAVEFKLAQGTIAINNATLKSMAAQAAGEHVSLALNAVGAGSLTPSQQAVMKTGDLVFSITATSGAQAIRNFDGRFTISVPYGGITPVGVWYLSDSAAMEKLECIYNPATKTLSFSTSHLSLYVIRPDADGITRIRFTIGALSYTLSGVLQTMDAAPMLLDDRAMVPLRFAAEALGAKVDWNGESSTVTMLLGDDIVTVVIGELAPGMDAPAMIAHSRTFVPIRYISEALRCEVTWNPDTQEINITK